MEFEKPATSSCCASHRCRFLHRQLLLIIIIIAILVQFQKQQLFCKVSSFQTSNCKWNRNRITIPSKSDIAEACSRKTAVYNSINNKNVNSNDNQDDEEWSDFDGYIGDASGSTSSSSTGSSSNKQKYEPLKYDDDEDDDDNNTPIPMNVDFTKLYQEKLNAAKTSGSSSSSSSSSNEQSTNSIKIEKNSNSKVLDVSGCQIRQFLLGKDIAVTNYVGNMGFDEVTDWEYYYTDEEDEEDNNNNKNIKSSSRSKTSIERKVVQPNPFDSSTPKRTRKSSGSVIRIFRGEFVGTLGGSIRSFGYDSRIIIKEFSGTLALSLASTELQTIGTLQTNLLLSLQGKQYMYEYDNWSKIASERLFNPRQDNSNVIKLLQLINNKASYVGVLGEVNLSDIDDGGFNYNDFYRTVGVSPPTSDSIWLVYEYSGLSTIQSYSIPPIIRLRSLSPTDLQQQRQLQQSSTSNRNPGGIFGMFFGSGGGSGSSSSRTAAGNTIDSLIPSFEQRSRYVVQGIMKQCIEAIAYIHENNIVHRSIGRSSFILSWKNYDKREAALVSTTNIQSLRIKISDFGFSCPISQISIIDDEFCTRARAYKIYCKPGDSTIITTNFAIAEDMYALGFVFIGLLLTSLANIPNDIDLNKDNNPKSVSDYRMPNTDEDTIQRLFGEIFDNDIEQFCEYVEADDIWSELVQLLDTNNRSGWKVLETLLLARQRVAMNNNNNDSSDESQILTIRGLLSNPFFNQS